MAQHRRRDVDQGRALAIAPRGKAAAMDEQERALLVDAKPAMLAKAGDVLGPREIADDVAVPGHAIRVDPVVGLQGNRNPRRRAGRQADLAERVAGDHPADPGSLVPR